jgi:hypothetical protein
LRIPKLPNRTIPAAGDGTLATAAINGNGSHGDLEINVVMEADDAHAGDDETGLARCARKEADGTFEQYEEDDQQLPGGKIYGEAEDDDDEPTRKEIDMIHQAEQLACQRDEAASDSEVDDSDPDSTSNESSDDGNDGDGDFIPKLKLRGKAVPKKFRLTGCKKHKAKAKANYIFCPLAHRLSILRLVCKHFCQHPLLREWHGQPRTRMQIYRNAVLETYYHCKANNLREVWAYLWTNWYAPGKWELWARSSYEGAIPRKRTTMLVESLWRNFKRMVLYHYNRPRVDLATYALVTHGIAPYRVRFNQIVKNPRDGRAKALRGEQLPIK